MTFEAVVKNGRSIHDHKNQLLSEEKANWFGEIEGNFAIKFTKMGQSRGIPENTRLEEVVDSVHHPSPLSPSYSVKMVSLRLQKRLAASVLKCGQKRIWLDPNEIAEIAVANSRMFDNYSAKLTIRPKHSQVVQ